MLSSASSHFPGLFLILFFFFFFIMERTSVITQVLFCTCDLAFKYKIRLELGTISNLPFILLCMCTKQALWPFMFNFMHFDLVYHQYTVLFSKM